VAGVNAVTSYLTRTRPDSAVSCTFSHRSTDKIPVFGAVMIRQFLQAETITFVLDGATKVKENFGGTTGRQMQADERRLPRSSCTDEQGGGKDIELVPGCRCTSLGTRR
jgi:hypothetical protein